jgi:hypothetical protein
MAKTAIRSAFVAQTIEQQQLGEGASGGGAIPTAATLIG